MTSRLQQTSRIRRRLLSRALAMPAALTLPGWAQQPAWPARPVKLVVPFPPGSAGDGVSRMLAVKLQASLGQAVVIDNKPGATGNIAAESVVRAVPDGLTLLSATSSIVISPWLQKAPFDPIRDLMPVSQTVAGSYVLLVHPSFAARTLAEWIAAVKKAPGRYSYGSYGNGSGPHLAMELLKARAGLFITHVPYRGAAPAMQDLMAGQIDMAFDTTAAALPQVQAGKVRAIALGGPSFSDALPGVPTLAQSFAGFDTDGWQGIFAPARTPREIVKRLADETALAMQLPDVTQRLKDLGFRSVGSAPGAFAALVAADYERYGRLIRERQIKSES